MDTENRFVITRSRCVWGGGRGVCGKMGEMSQGGAKVQTSSCKINKSWECNIQHGDYS